MGSASRLRPRRCAFLHLHDGDTRPVSKTEMHASHVVHVACLYTPTLNNGWVPSLQGPTASLGIYVNSGSQYEGPHQTGGYFALYPSEDKGSSMIWLREAAQHLRGDSPLQACRTCWSTWPSRPPPTGRASGSCGRWAALWMPQRRSCTASAASDVSVRAHRWRPLVPTCWPQHPGSRSFVPSIANLPKHAVVIGIHACSMTYQMDPHY